jgi:hypothetical protein
MSLNTTNYIPTDFIVAQGNAFYLRVGTLFAAPVLAAWGPTEIEWTEAVEVERHDENQHIFDAVYRALDAVALVKENA